MAEREPRSVPTVLVADDDPDLVALMARRLAKAGYDLLTAATAPRRHSSRPSTSRMSPCWT